MSFEQCELEVDLRRFFALNAPCAGRAAALACIHNPAAKKVLHRALQHYHDNGTCDQKRRAVSLAERLAAI